jgi:hypothetical protein
MDLLSDVPALAAKALRDHSTLPPDRQTATAGTVIVVCSS